MANICFYLLENTSFLLRKLSQSTISFSSWTIGPVALKTWSCNRRLLNFLKKRFFGLSILYHSIDVASIFVNQTLPDIEFTISTRLFKNLCSRPLRAFSLMNAYVKYLCNGVYKIYTPGVWYWAS